jgi:ATP-dependent helicase/nuclease subunit A
MMESVRDALATRGIAARISGASQKFFTRLEVRDLANALRAVADPYDDFSLLATLYGPFGGLSLDSVVLLAKETPVVENLAEFVTVDSEDGERLSKFLAWFEPMREYADRLAAWEVIADLFAKTPYLEVLASHPSGERQIANARKLLMLASQEPLIGPLEYAELIRETQMLGHREGDAPYGGDQNRVTLSTIHSSKGLEYPIVVLAETNSTIDRMPGSVLVDAGRSLVATNFNRFMDARFRHLNGLQKERGREEEQRVLYVALTRARRRLCVVLYPPGKKLTLSGMLQGRERLDRYPGVRVRGTWAETPSQVD